jgi:glycosyltransferase involved in cell wall biosynthesis
MTLGLPVVTVDSGGIPFLVTNNVNGKVVKFDDVDAMVNAITNIIANPEEGKQLVANAKEYSQQYGEDSVIKKWEMVFKNLN